MTGFQQEICSQLVLTKLCDFLRIKKTQSCKFLRELKPQLWIANECAAINIK